MADAKSLDVIRIMLTIQWLVQSLREPLVKITATFIQLQKRENPLGPVSYA